MTSYQIGIYICKSCWRGSHRNRESLVSLLYADGEQVSRGSQVLRLGSSFGYELAASADDVEPDEGLARIIASHPTEPECVDLAQSWYHRCNIAHGSACGTKEDSSLLKRLIYILSSEDEPLKLCNTKGQQGRYVALSYCWGKGSTFITTSHTLDERMKGFAVGALPKTLQDAVHVVRQFGMHWVWINAICILQGDALDWSRESSLMVEVYGNANFVICADVASDTDEGFLVQRNLKTSHRFGPHEGSCLQEISGDWDQMCLQALYCRGWAFQERLLAPRILHFLDDQIVWECNTALYREGFRGCERSPRNHFAKREFAPYVHQRRWQEKPTESGHGADIDLHTRLYAWNYIIQEVAVRNFTVKTDNLPAVSGLASAYEIPELGRYFAGIWEANPFLSIVWYARWSQSAPNAYLAPSWSWAWTSGQLIWHAYVYKFDVSKEVIDSWRLWDKRYGPRLESYHMRFRSDDPKGGILSGGHLVMNALCRTVYIAERPGTTFDEWHGIVLPRRENGSYAYMDHQNDRRESVTSFKNDLCHCCHDIEPNTVVRFTCVQIARDRRPAEDNPKTFALVLEKVDGYDIYRRQGLLAFDFREAECSN